MTHLMVLITRPSSSKSKSVRSSAAFATTIFIPFSESDILDRFKERKVGLTVESQFDPTRIKKAEVVLKELLGEHGRQFAKVTPQYERIAASNAVILVFKVEEGPK